MEERTYSKNITNAINSFLTGDGWHFSFDDQHGIFKFGLCFKGLIKKVSYIVYVKEDGYIVYAVFPLGVDDDDEKMMVSMAEFVCRANYGLKNGNFEINMTNGEIRFKSFVDCEGITPTFEMVKNSIYCPAVMFDRYGMGIVDIIFGNATAKEAITRCEKSLVEELYDLLGEKFDEDENIEAMIARLVARFGIDESAFLSDDEQLELTEGEVDVKTELFKLKGGAT